MFSIVHCATLAASARLSAIIIFKENQRVDRLRTALDVERQCLLRVVARRAIGQKERTFPIFVSTHHGLKKAPVSRALRVVLETVQYVCRMEVVDPVQISLLAVIPRAIGPLILRRILDRLLRQRSIRFVPRVRKGSCKQTGSQCVGVVDPFHLTGNVSDTERLSIGKSLKIANNVLTSAYRHFKVAVSLKMCRNASRKACPINEVQTIVGTPLGK